MQDRRWKIGKKSNRFRDMAAGDAKKLVVHSASMEERSLNDFSVAEFGSKRVETFSRAR